eukprot:2819598-Prymnesium_polylepis.1
MEMPRDRWLNEYCAQLCITTSQIWWSSEVNQAFERLEQGNDQAIKDYSQVVINGLTHHSSLSLLTPHSSLLTGLTHHSSLATGHWPHCSRLTAH